MPRYNTIPIEKLENDLLRALANECARKGYASKITEREEDSKQFIKVAKLKATFSEESDSVAMSPFENQDTTFPKGISPEAPCFFERLQYTPEGLAKMIIRERKLELKELSKKKSRGIGNREMRAIKSVIESLGGNVLYGDSDILMVRATEEVKTKIMKNCKGVNIHFQIQKGDLF